MQEKDLLERDVALTKLDLALREAQGKGGRTILLRGEAGIGKTSLLRHWTAGAAQNDGAQVFWGGCEALFTPRPLGPVMDIAAALGPSVHQALQQHSAPELFASIASWLSMPAAALGSRGGVKRVSMLVVEDAHWADHLTLDFLKYIARRIHQWPALLLISYRDDEVGPMHPLTQVLGDLPAASSEAIDLQPLSFEALSELSGFSTTKTKELMDVTGGNPFFATEIIATASRTAHAAVPATVAAAVLARAQRVSAPARRVLEAASLVPKSMEQSVVMELVGQDAGSGIDECVAAGLLRWEDRGIAFRHELARRAIEHAMSPLKCREWHARIYTQLGDDADDHLDRKAYHARHADDSDAVLKTAPAAGERAMALGAPREAAAHFSAALEHAGAAAPQMRAHLLERWGEAASTCAIPFDQQFTARREAIALREKHGPGVKLGMNLLFLASLHVRVGESDLALQAVDRAQSVLEALPPGVELARAYAFRSSWHMMANEWEATQSWGRRSLDLADALNLREVEVTALNNMGVSLAESGDDQGFAMLERSLSLALELKLPGAAVRAWGNGGEAALRRRRIAQAEQWLSAGLEFAKQHDLDRWIPNLTAPLAHGRIAQGRLAAAVEGVAEAMSVQAVDASSSAILRAVEPHVALLRDDANAAQALRPLFETALALRRADEVVPIALALAEAAWLLDDAAMCREVVVQAVHACAALTTWDRGELACWYHRASGDVKALGNGPMAEPCDAEISGDLDRAARLWRERAMPRHEAWVLTLKDPQEDPEALTEAIAIFDRIDASACVRHARKLARRHSAAGFKGIRTGPRSARSNHFGLTPRQLQIASHLAHGRSNADIARLLSRSERTVEHHVATVLEKLGTQRRHEVARVLGAVGELDSTLALTVSQR